MRAKLPASVLAAIRAQESRIEPIRLESAQQPIRVLGVDTSLRSTGLGIVESVGSSIRLIDCRPIKTPASWTLSACLFHLSNTLENYLAEFSPDEVALEGIFFCKNAKSALLLGHARGALISTCAKAALPMFEYPPRRIKQAVTGTGTATKEQIQRMMMHCLNLDTLPQEDASDALAIAITHLHSRSAIAALTSKPL